MNTSSSRGFTLIELLVVIAIIGILSSVVLGGLYVARLRGADAAIQSNLHTLQTQMEVLYSNNTTYGPAFASQTSAQTTVPSVGTNVFITDPTVNSALKNALAQGGGAYWAVGVNGASWAVEVSLKSSSLWWCLDSSGSPKKEATGGSLGGGPSVASCP